MVYNAGQLIFADDAEPISWKVGGSAMPAVDMPPTELERYKPDLTQAHYLRRLITDAVRAVDAVRAEYCIHAGHSSEGFAVGS